MGNSSRKNGWRPTPEAILDKTLPTIIVVILTVIAIAAMYAGWRALRRRQADIPRPKPVPDDLGPALHTSDLLYVGTTAAGDPYARIAVDGLAFRGNAKVTVTPGGIAGDYRGAGGVHPGRGPAHREPSRPGQSTAPSKRAASSPSAGLSPMTAHGTPTWTPICGWSSRRIRLRSSRPSPGSSRQRMKGNNSGSHQPRSPRARGRHPVNGRAYGARGHTLGEVVFATG